MSNIMSQLEEFIKDKKILVVGLGSLSGGVATCLWLLKHRAKLTITDLRTKNDLSSSLKKLKRYLPQIKLRLGCHQKNDFKNNDIIVVNPGVKIENNPYLKIAKKEKKFIENEMSLFFRFNQSPLIAITGTRGKTTITNWIGHFLRIQHPQTIIGGNMPDSPVLSFLDKTRADVPVILEISSFQLELLKEKYQAPKIAIITNLFRDHLNRHNNMKNYAKIKANIFKNQQNTDYLILNYQDKWTKFFLSFKPKSQIYFISNKPLPKSKNGIFNKANRLYFQNNQKQQLILNLKNFSQQWGKHNLNNLMFSILAAHLFGLNFSLIAKSISCLPHIQFREEIIHQSPDKKLIIINDSSATTPEATIAALERFTLLNLRSANSTGFTLLNLRSANSTGSTRLKNNNLILITGGTDKNLKFDEMARKIKKTILPQNLIILNGSASQKLIKGLTRIKYSNYYSVFESLDECLSYGFCRLKQNKKNIILFSPGAASFEKFQNEFDRGKKFNELIKNIKLLK